MLPSGVVSNELLYTTTRIASESKGKPSQVGTGFFFRFASGDAVVPVLVTNRHVVEEASSATIWMHRTPPADKNTLVDIPLALKVVFGDMWTNHPDPDVDLCAMPIQPLLDSVTQRDPSAFVRFLDERLIPSNVERLSWLACEEVLMVGYPIGLWDDVNNLPLMRRGTTATHPGVRFKGAPIGMIDIGCYPGSSGSPVYAVRDIQLRSEGYSEPVRQHYLLGIVFATPTYDARGEAETAFGHFARGNVLRREDLARLGRSFDGAAHEQFIDAVAGLFDGDFLAARRGFGDASTLPVFVVGMPRSGTTLVEQILASHPDVFGAGELDALGGFVPRFPEGVKELDAEAAADLARSHVERLSGLGGPALRVVDKTPLNFLYLGLISLLFPAARIVHCRRDARDVCLSCFAQNFVAGHGWSTDLADLATYFRQYGRLMAHWHDVLPLPVLDVDYEAVVADPGAESRRLVDFLDLPWDDACLRFHEARHVVRSASNWQVRRPVHGGSVGRWRAYERWLGPLL